jgi:hypothetical protein
LRGTMFDSAALDAFFRVEQTIVSIASAFKDEEVRIAPPSPPSPLARFSH